MVKNPDKDIFDPEFLYQASRKLKHAKIHEILEWTFKIYGDDVAMTTAFGYSGVVLLHHVIQVHPTIQIYFIDTGFHFEETLQFRDRIQDEWKLNLTTVKPSIEKKKFLKKFGPNPFASNPDLCCHYNKVEPLLTFIHNQDVWLSGIRRDQSSTRAGVDIIEMDGRGLVKVSPMVHWTKDNTWDYIRENEILYNPLHDKGFPSIGCQPCTHPVGEGGNERDGRWPFMQKLECGIHLHQKKKVIRKT